MAGFVYRKISCLITNQGVVEKGGIRPVEVDLGLKQNSTVVFSKRRGVLWVGPDKELPRMFRSKPWRHLDCRGFVAYPGLVDAHTHPIFAGDRSREFELRMAGATYREIAAAGGGIVNSVKSTRAAGKKTLAALFQERLNTAHSFGVRLMETKSGYGLDIKTEIMSLEIIKELKNPPIKLVATCLAAHAIPAEKKGDRLAYLGEIREKILPKVARLKLADYVDVFCDEGYFSVEETMDILYQAKKLNLGTRVHGEELTHSGIAKMAAEFGAHSVDHLLKVDQAGIRAMARAGTVAILLPGTSFYLKLPPAPARELIDTGAVVALATDFNPGTCPTQNLPFIGSIAAMQLGMKTAEIIAALTWNGARSLRKEKSFGAILPGFLGEPCFVRGDHPSALFYQLAPAGLLTPPSFTT